MKNKLILSIAIFAFSLLSIPQMTFASWWKPNTWKIFNRKYEVKIEQKIIATSTLGNRIVQMEKTTTTPALSRSSDQSVGAEKIEQKSEETKKPKAATGVLNTSAQKKDAEKEIEKLKKEVEALKQKIEKQSSVKPESDTPIVNTTPLNITVCNGKHWTNCPTGQNFYCPSTGDAQCLIENVSNQNSSTQNQQFYVVLPTFEQLAGVRRLCLADANIKALCDGSEFMAGYFSNLKFRVAIDDFVRQYDAFISEQQRQQIANEKSTINCLMAIMPEELRVLDPSTQYYLRQLKCGTATESDKATYELQQIKSSVDDLKYRLDSKVSFQPLLLDTVQLPTLNTAGWQVRWDGSGGTVTTSNGGIYQFHCEDNTCRSY